MKKVITFVNDTPHVDVENLSTTYQSAIFFSENSYNDNYNYQDIYHGTYLYSYIQGVNSDRNTVLYSSGQFRINYEEDMLSASYIYLSDEEVTLYPSTNPQYASQNEYKFNIYHSNDITIDNSRLFYDKNIFNLTNNILSIKNIDMDSAETTLKYKCDNGAYIYTNIHIIRNNPKFSFEYKEFNVNNNSNFSIPFSLTDNQNHSAINYSYDSEYIIKYDDLNFKTQKETAKDSYTVIYANIDDNVSYAYVTIAPNTRAESMSISKYVGGAEGILDTSIDYSNFIPYETAYINANTGSNNLFKVKIYPKSATYKNVEWYSTDPETMKIVSVNNVENVVKVKYYRPGKVILYAVHEKNNDNFLRALMTVNITGGVIITKIFPITDVTPTHVIDGDQINFVIGHQPVDSELNLLFEGEGESYIHSDRNKYQVDKYTDESVNTAYSYFITYADVVDWEENTQKTYTFAMSYTEITNTQNYDRYAFTDPITFYKLYSESGSCKVERKVGTNNKEISPDSTIYYGDDNGLITYNYNCYPNNPNAAVSIGNMENNTSYTLEIRGNGKYVNLDNERKYLSSNNNISAKTVTIEGELLRDDIMSLGEGDYTIYTNFSYQYNNTRKLNGNSVQQFSIKSPLLSSNTLDVTYGFSGSIGTYTIMPNTGTVNSFSNVISGLNGASVNLENSTINVTNIPKLGNVNPGESIPNIAGEYNISYTIKNGEYVSDIKNMSINIVPVEIYIQNNNQTITSFIQNIDEPDENITISLGLLFGPFENVVNFDTASVAEVTTYPVKVDVNIQNNNLVITKKPNVIFNDTYDCTIKIKNIKSGCSANLNLKISLNKVYIIILSVTQNDQIYYNSVETNTNYKNNADFIIRGNAFYPDLSTVELTTPVTITSESDKLILSNSSIEIGPKPENKSRTINISSDNYLHTNVIFTYKSNADGHPDTSISMPVNTYMLPYSLQNFLGENTGELYENQSITFNINVKDYNRMEPSMKEASYWFINDSNNKFTKTSQYEYRLKNYSGMAQFPVEKYTELTYGINANYTPTGSTISYNANLYLMYSYFSYEINDIYYGLNIPVQFKINAYVKPEDNMIAQQKIYLDYISGFNDNAFILSNPYYTEIPITYESVQLNSNYREHKFNLYNQSFILSNAQKYDIGVLFKGITYTHVRGDINRPNISLISPVNNFKTYTNGIDDTQWPKSLIISYDKTGVWPNDYDGTWSYIFGNNEVEILENEYYPEHNSASTQFKLQCDNIITSANIKTETLCDTFAISSNNPIIVSQNRPYTLINTISGINSRISNQPITCAPVIDNMSIDNGGIVLNNQNVISYIKHGSTSFNITYNSGCHTNQHASFEVYAISYGISNQYFVKGGVNTITGYVNGITFNESTDVEYSCNHSGVSISGTTLDLTDLTNINFNDSNLPTLPIKMEYTPGIHYDNNRYLFETTQNITVYPYRWINIVDQKKYINALSFQVELILDNDSSSPQLNNNITEFDPNPSSSNYSVLTLSNNGDQLCRFNIPQIKISKPAGNLRLSKVEFDVEMNDDRLFSNLPNGSGNSITVSFEHDGNYIVKKGSDQNYFDVIYGGQQLDGPTYLITIGPAAAGHLLRFNQNIEFNSESYSIPPAGPTDTTHAVIFWNASIHMEYVNFANDLDILAGYGRVKTQISIR